MAELFDFAKAEWVSALGTLLAAMTSVVLAYFTYRLAILTSDLAREQKLMREIRFHAEVELAVEPHRAHVNVLELVVANCGQSTAKDVAIIMDGALIRNNNDPIGSRKHIISAILPGKQHRIFLASAAGKAATDGVRATVTYSDARGVRQSRLEQTVGGLFGFSRIGEEPDFAAAKALADIARTLDGWNGFRKLAVDVYNKNDRERELAEREVFVAKADREFGAQVSQGDTSERKEI